MSKLHDQATPEEISTHLNDIIPKAKAETSSYHNSNRDEVIDTMAHPNFSKENFDQIYNNFSSPEDTLNHSEVLESLSDHPNWSVNHANEVVKNAAQGEGIGSLISKLAKKHSDLDLTPIEQRALREMDEPSKADDMPDYEKMNLNPKFYLDLLHSAPEITEEYNLTPEQEALNLKARKHNAFGIQGIVNSQKHTPETLQQSLDLLMHEKINKRPVSKYSFGRDSEHQFDTIKNFVNKQKGLSKDQLNTIYQKAEQRPVPNTNDYSAISEHYDLPEAILEHSQVDPILLGKAARTQSTYYSDGRRSAALRNSQLPHEVINGILQDDEELKDSASDLADNASLTKEHLNTLFDKGYQKHAINHPNSDEELHKKFWDNSDKSTEAARTILESKNAPPSILKEIVNHKNKNVAIDAINHKNTNEDVLNEGLNRKMKDVQDAARKHPLVADRELKKGFLDGKVKLSDILNKKQESNHFSKLSQEEKAQAYEKISQKLKGTNLTEIERNSKEDPEKIFELKYHLATSPDVPENIKNENIDDIIEAFNPAHNSSDFEDFYYRGPKKAVYTAFNEFVKSGNKKAEDHALGKLGYLMNISRHFRDTEDKDKVSSSFLDKAFEKVSSSKGQNLINRFGLPNEIKDEDVTNSLKNLAQFKNLSQENFDKYLLADPSKSHSDRYLNYARRQSDGTVLDARFESLPEDEKRQKFSKYLNPVQAFAVAASNSAPQDLKDQAFEMLNPEERHELINEANNDMAGFSPNILQNALLGKYNNPNEDQHEHELKRNKGASSYESEALNRLDSGKEEHKNVLEAYLSHLSSKEGRKPDDNTIAERLGTKWLIDHLDLFKKHAQSHSLLYFNSVDKNLESKIHSYDRDNQQRQDDAAIFLQNEANQFAAASQNPEQAQIDFWDHALRRYASGPTQSNKDIGKILGHTEKNRTSNGKLDFLVDLGKKDKRIKELLLSKNILSPEKRTELTNTFSDYGEYLDSLSPIDKSAEMRAKITSWKEKKSVPTEEEVHHIMDRLSTAALTSAHLGSPKWRMGESALKEYDENLKTMFNAIDSASGRQIDVRDLVNSSFTLPNKKDKDDLGVSLFNHILQNSKPETQADNIDAFYQGMQDSGSMSPKVLDKIADYAYNNNKLETLVKIFKQSEKVSKSVSSKITDLVKNVKNLDSDNLLNISELYEHEKFTISNIKKINSAFEASLINHTPEEVADLRQRYVNQFDLIGKNMPEEKMNFFASVLQKYSTFPETRQASLKILGSYLNSGTLDEKNKKSIYLHLPDETELSGYKIPTLSINLVNDSEILENSVSGWKLESLIKSVDNMNSDTISTFVNRITLSDEQPLKNKYHILGKLSSISATKKEDLTKIIRSLSDNEINDYINRKVFSNFLESHVSPLLDHLSEKLTDLHTNPQKYPQIADESSLSSELLTKIGTISTIFKHSELEGDMTLQKEVYESYSNAIKAICDASHKAGINKETQKPIFSAIKNIRDAKMPINGEDLVRTLSVVKSIENTGEVDPAFIMDTGHELIKKTEGAKPEIWQHIASEHPAYPYMLHSTNLTKEMIDPINLDSEFQKNTKVIAHQVGYWFDQMDDEALKAHGANIMNSLMKHVNGEEYAVSHSIKTGLRIGHRFMDPILIKKALNSLPESEKDEAKEICIKNGTGGEEFIKSLFNDSLLENGNIKFNRTTKSLMESPFVTNEMADIALKSFESGSPELDDIAYRLFYNKHTPTETIDKMADHYKQGNISWSNELIKHPKISYEKAKELYNLKPSKDTPNIFYTSGKFHPIFLNPTHGSRFLRELPPASPEALNKYGISANKMQRDILAGGKNREKIYEVIKNIPTEGIAWPEFKRKFPKYENVAEIKNVFMSKNNRPAVPEDFTHLLSEADEKDKFNSFHVTFSSWNGAQRHKDQTNLVVQLNTSQKADLELSKDPKAWSLYQFILKHSNGIESESIGYHPTTPHLISWSRVDVSNEDAWIIEEFQSDVAQKFRKNIRSLLKNSPSGLKLDGKIVTPDEIKKYAIKIDEAFSNWQKASMEAVLQNAKAHGIKKVYMHGYGIRSTMSGSGRVYGIEGRYTKNHVNPRIVENYDGVAQKYGFKKCDYTDYPNYSKSILKETVDSKEGGRDLPSHCWLLEIA